MIWLTCNIRLSRTESFEPELNRIFDNFVQSVIGTNSTIFCPVFSINYKDEFFSVNPVKFLTHELNSVTPTPPRRSHAHNLCRS